jgi:hypothetical protein
MSNKLPGVTDGIKWTKDHWRVTVRYSNRQTLKLQRINKADVFLARVEVLLGM